MALANYQDYDAGDTLLTAADLRRIIPVSAMTIWRWRRDHLLPAPITLNGRLFWRRSTIDRWMADQQPGAAK